MMMMMMIHRDYGGRVLEKRLPFKGDNLMTTERRCDIGYMCWYYPLIGSRIRSCDWHQNSDLMTLNGVTTADARYLCNS